MPWVGRIGGIEQQENKSIIWTESSRTSVTFYGDYVTELPVGVARMGPSQPSIQGGPSEDQSLESMVLANTKVMGIITSSRQCMQLWNPKSMCVSVWEDVGWGCERNQAADRRFRSRIGPVDTTHLLGQTRSPQTGLTHSWSATQTLHEDMVMAENGTVQHSSGMEWDGRCFSTMFFPHRHWKPFPFQDMQR